MHSFCSETLKERPFGRQSYRSAENIENRSSRNRMADMDWTDLAQDRHMWQDIADMVKLWVS